MYVKSVTLKGFKSFASATTLRLEPGITCIVGPNGSGKSNVVDALAWVMGEQGAKSLRGGKMEDVIFAGTAGRAPLGRAEVALTIDNTDGALPIDYTEVTISRTMFRNGGSDYAINGTSCRLLDIQELLSDSGIGREMHVIVGQGQLDTVLRATPEERRGFIEEAAGVLKHRKRKERALRKLDTMEANLTRAQDLTTEIRRQLGPLGRQAETARKAGVIQAEVRDARLRLIADDLVQLTATLEQEVADETALVARRTEVEAALSTLGARLTALEVEADESRPRLAAAQAHWFALTQLLERFTSTATLAGERVRLLAEDEADQVGPATGPALARDPEAMRAQAATLRVEHVALLGEITAATAALAQAVTTRADTEARYAAEQHRLAALARAVADRREGLAKLAGQVAARASRVEAGEAEVGRLRASLEQIVARSADAEREFARLEASIAVDEEGEEGLDAAYERASAELEVLQSDAERLRDEERTADRDRQAAGARADALELSLTRRDGAATLLGSSHSGPREGVLGSVSALVEVAEGHEAAIAAALGWAAEAVAVTSLDAAVAGVDLLRAEAAGRVGMLVGATARPAAGDAGQALPPGARWAVEFVSSPEPIRAAVNQLLGGIALVGSADLARTLVADGVTAVTPEGDVFAPGFVVGGDRGAPSLLELESAMEAARAATTEAAARAERARFALSGVRERILAAQAQTDATLERLHESDARMSAVAEQLGHLGSIVRGAKGEADRVERAIVAAVDTIEGDRVAHAELASRLAAATDDADDEDLNPDVRDELEAAAAATRGQETEARLTLRTREERARAVLERAESLEAAAEAELAARERLAARRERRAREAQIGPSTTPSAPDCGARWACSKRSCAS